MTRRPTCISITSQSPITRMDAKSTANHRRMPLFILLVCYLSNEAGTWNWIKWIQNGWINGWNGWVRMKSMKWTKLHEMDMEMYEMDETNGYDESNGRIWMEMDGMDEYGWNGWKWCQIHLPLFRPASQHSSNDIPLSLQLSNSTRFVWPSLIVKSQSASVHCVLLCILLLCFYAPFQTSEIRIARVTTDGPYTVSHIREPFNSVPGPGLTARQRR